MRKIRIGDVFNKLTVIEYCPYGLQRRRKDTWKVRCECGTEKLIHGYLLFSGVIVSCGCSRYNKFRNLVYKDASRGKMSDHREYAIWTGMKKRCYQSNCINYHTYGGKGITICERWRNSFWNFYDDMGNMPDGDYSIERKDSLKNYEPSNCMWLLRKEQNRNRSSVIWITYKGKTQILADWARELGIYKSTLGRYYKKFNSIEMAVEKCRFNEDAKPLLIAADNKYCFN